MIRERKSVNQRRKMSPPTESATKSATKSETESETENAMRKKTMKTMENAPPSLS